MGSDRYSVSHLDPRVSVLNDIELQDLVRYPMCDGVLTCVHVACDKFMIPTGVMRHQLIYIEIPRRTLEHKAVPFIQTDLFINPLARSCPLSSATSGYAEGCLDT